MRINQFWLRAMGVSGIIGGLLLFTGDMLFNYDTNNINLLENRGNASDFSSFFLGSTIAIEFKS